jgi:hypothetical protein
MSKEGAMAPETELLDRRARCEIRVQGHLAARWSEWFDGMTLTQTESGQTLIAGPLADQSALRGLLAKVLDLNLTLLSLRWIEPADDEPDT